MRERLVVGTAQLGQAYGIANDLGQPSEEGAIEAIGAAVAAGVWGFDTAQGYGDSESVLGRSLTGIEGASACRIVTKLSPDLDPLDTSTIRSSVEKSRNLLGVDSLWGLMMHRASWLSDWDGRLGSTLTELKERGVVKRLGVSVYTVAQAFDALERTDLEVMQIPCSAWDQRMLKEGVLESARERNVQCFVRSIYLQGLLVLPPEVVEIRLPSAAAASRRWHACASEFGVTATELAFRFASSLDALLVVGAETEEQVRDNIRMTLLPPLTSDERSLINDHMQSCVDDSILSPAKWRDHVGSS